MLVGNILEGKQEQFAKNLHELSQDMPFNSLKFELLVDQIRTHVAKVSWNFD